MLIAITGTPGTGKTGVARILAKLLDAKQIGINELADKGKLNYTYDRKRKTREIDTKELSEAVSKEVEKNRIELEKMKLMREQIIVQSNY